MSLKILDAGLATQVVDFGRPRSRSLGIPVGGAADRACFELANRLLGNPPDHAALEIAVKGPIVRAEADVAIAVVGAPFTLAIGPRRIAGNATRTLKTGEELVIGGTPRGMRAYLAVAGGFDVPTISNSRSGLKPLAAGTSLPCRSSQTPSLRLSPECPFLSMPGEWRLRAIAGPQADEFPPGAFFGHDYVVHHSSNRMGLRLDGPLFPPEKEMVSEPVAPGCVQIARDGQPIVLGVDGQTIGGYPKIAAVIDADRDTLGQLRPGDRVVFDRVDLEIANTAWEERRRTLAEWTTRIQVVRVASG